ncbi:hypothetical protein SH467x_003053 [Pirellulaceae bacterium SH467]
MRLRFPRHRLTVLDILAASRTVPAFPIHRTFQLASVEIARKASPIKIGWTALFLKAFATVCTEVPSLRDLFVSYPIRHLYRHPHSVASVSVHRNDELGNERLIWGQLRNPESLSLIEIQRELSRMVTAPLREVYRDGLILESFPVPIRRLAWWWVMRCSGRKRAKHVGTFSVSSLGGQGCLNAHHPLVTSTSLAMGPLTDRGSMDVVLLCDHRMMDGILGAQALARLEQWLQTGIVDELKSSVANKA